MTEPTTKAVDPAQQVAPVEQAIDGMLPAPAGLFDATIEAGLAIKARSQWSYARRRFLRHRLAMLGLVGLVVIFGAGIFANFIAPYSYSAIDLNNILHPPTTTAHHFFGTDEIGRDYFSRVIWGIRTSEEVGLLVAVVSSVIGLLVGAALVPALRDPAADARARRAGRRWADESAAMVADGVPGAADRGGRALRQLHGRRTARRARPDAAESPCLSRSCRFRISQSSSR